MCYLLFIPSYLFLLINTVLKLRIFTYSIILLSFLQLENLFSQNNLENKNLENKWAIELNQQEADKNHSGIELMHAEEGKYLGAQKSKEGILIFHGGTRIKINNYVLLADTIKINPETGELFGEGGVTLTDGFQIIKGSKFFYSNSLKVGILYDLDGFVKPLYIIGEYAKVTSTENLIISAAFLSTCEAETAHYFFKVKKIWLRPDNQFVAIGIVYYIAKVPLFYLPFLLQTDLGTGIHSLIGYTTFNGIYLQNSYFYGFSKNNIILPSNAMLMFDFYQFQGFYFGTYMNKKSKNLDYDISIGIASKIIQDQIVPNQGTISNSREVWHEVNALLNPRWSSSMDKDAISALNVTFEQYNDPAFDKTFKQRTIPDNTINAIAIYRTLYYPAQPRNSLLWKAVYSENWQDNSFVVVIDKYQQWQNYLNGYNYYPVHEIFPSLTYKKNWYVVKPTGSVFQGISNNIDVVSRIEHQYNQGQLFHTLNYLDVKSGLNAFLPFHNLISLQPSIGYGVTGQFYNNGSAIDNLENDKKSYQYFYTLDKLFLGPSFLKSTIMYALKWATVEKITDPYFKQERENKLYLLLSSDFAPFGSISLGSARDLRKLPGVFKEQNQWDPFFVSAFFDYDFINHDNIFLPEVYNPNTYFLGIGTSESFYYNINFNKPGINSLSLYLQTGGYRFLIIDRLEKAKIGFNWVHDFINYNRNRIQFIMETKAAFLKYWWFGLNLSTNVYNTGTQASPYQYVGESFVTMLNSNNANSSFELDKIEVSIEHDLHDWLMKFSYSITQNWIYYGKNNQNIAGYYDHGIYVSFTLKGFNGFGIPKTQINPREIPIPYGLN